MFKILVADDERFIRRGIISILSKNIIDEIFCIEASNGLEALDCLKGEQPDLIITDICMPGCDGLEFISKLKEQNRKTPVIILSGYENFDYAKRAIKLGVKEYVMKPIKKADFIELIQGYIDHIRVQQKLDHEQAVRMIENARTMEKLKRDFLVGLLKCRDEKQSRQYLLQLENVGMKFESQYYTCAVMEYDMDESNKDYMDFAVKNVLDEYLSLESEEFLTNVSYGNGILVAIFESDSRGQLKESKKRIIIRAAQTLKEYCKVQIYAGLGDIAYDSVHLYKAIRHAMYAADFKILESGETVSVYEECPGQTQNPQTRIVSEIRKSGEIEVHSILQLFQDTYINCRKHENVLLLKTEYEEVTDYLLRKCSRGTYEEWNKLPREFSSLFSITQLKKELKYLIQSTQAAMQEAEGNISNTALMKQILLYIDEHITEELDLATVADQFSRTPGYISTLFKKHVEGGFNHYINKERMEIAMKLLKDHSLSVQEISELTGYNNSKYFSVVFKKLTGTTPRSFRERECKARETGSLR